MHIDTFIWDMTHACPLRCIHCYSESGRRPGGSRREDVVRIARELARVKPRRVALSGGEPLLAPGWDEALQCLHDAGIEVGVFTSGWTLDETHARRLADRVSDMSVSLDGGRARTHDTIRGRVGSFARALAALELLARERRERLARGEPCYSLSVEMAVMRSNLAETELLVRELATRVPDLGTIQLGMVIPSGLATEEDFEVRELLAAEEERAFLADGARLAGLAAPGTRVVVDDVRLLFARPLPRPPQRPMGHIEPDGQMRAFEISEAKVGNVLEEPIEVLCERVLAWRAEPFVVEQFASIHTVRDWARVMRTLDWRYGSAADRERIARRRAVLPRAS